MIRTVRFELPDPAMVAVYRAMRPEQRVQAGLEATELVRQRLKAHFKAADPGLTERELDLAVAKRLLDDRD